MNAPPPPPPAAVTLPAARAAASVLVVVDPSAFADHPDLAAALDSLRHVLEHILAFVHARLTPKAQCGLHVLNSSSRIVPTLQPVSSAFVLDCIDAIDQALPRRAVPAWGAPRSSFADLADTLRWLGAVLGQTVTLGNAHPGTVSPARAPQDKLRGTVRLRQYVLVVGKFPTSEAAAREFLGSAEAGGGGLGDVAQSLADGLVWSSLLGNNTGLSWIHPGRLPADADRDALHRLFRCMGGALVATDEADLQVPLEISLGGMFPAAVHAPTLRAELDAVGRQAAPAAVVIHLHSSSASETVVAVPCTPVHAISFPRGPWRPLAAAPSTSLLADDDGWSVACQLLVSVSALPAGLVAVLDRGWAIALAMEGDGSRALLVLLTDGLAAFSVLSAGLSEIGAAPWIPLAECLTDEMCTDRVAAHPLPNPHALEAYDDAPPAFPTSDALATLDFDFFEDAEESLAPARPSSTPTSAVPDTPRRRAAATALGTGTSPHTAAALGAATWDDFCRHLQRLYWDLVYSPAWSPFTSLFDRLLALREHAAEIPGSRTLAAALAPMLLKSDKVKARYRKAVPAVVNEHLGLVPTAPPAAGAGEAGDGMSATQTAALTKLAMPSRRLASLSRSSSFSSKLKGGSKLSSAAPAPAADPTPRISDDEAAVIRSHVNAVHPARWLKECHVRERLVQVVLHLEVALDRVLTGAVGEDPDGEDARVPELAAVGSHVRAIPLLCVDADMVFPLRTQPNGAAAAKMDTGVRFKLWIEQALLFHYHDYFTRFVESLYREHGGELGAYLQHTANPFSPRLAKPAVPAPAAPAAPVITANRKRLQLLQQREISLPNLSTHYRPKLADGSGARAGRHSQDGAAAGGVPLVRTGSAFGRSTRSLARSNTAPVVPTASAAAPSAAARETTVVLGAPPLGRHGRTPTRRASDAVTPTKRAHWMAMSSSQGSVSGAAAAHDDEDRMDVDSPTSSRFSFPGGTAPHAPPLLSPTAKLRRKKVVATGLQFGNRLRGAALGTPPEAQCAMQVDGSPFVDTDRAPAAAPPALRLFGRVASVPSLSSASSSAAGAGAMPRVQSPPSVIAPPPPPQQAQSQSQSQKPAGEKVALNARGRPGFRKLFERYRGSQSQSQQSQQMQPPAPAAAPPGTPQRGLTVVTAAAAAGAGAPLTPLHRTVFSVPPTPGSASVRLSARKVGVAVDKIFSPFRDLSEVVREMEEEDEAEGDEDE
ncbi:hypothetical protein H9P43_008273 [Blastocladiella emersonii ATCC 22665]|nr:hypothetical protein H9P43_008273 [Blastocladiella emersonii ATCC 22665]